MSFFTEQQIKASATVSAPEPIPSFVIELISPSDTVKRVESKIIEYFNVGVQVVWHIHPELPMVRVFSSPRHNVTCFENDTFSAAAVVPDLQLTVEELVTVQQAESASVMVFGRSNRMGIGRFRITKNNKRP